MSEFKKAAKQAASDIWAEYDTYVSGDKMVEIIAKHFADLESTFEKLVEIVTIQDRISSGGTTRRLSELLADPAVVALLKGERNG